MTKNKKTLWILIVLFLLLLVIAGAAYQSLSSRMKGNNLMTEEASQTETLQPETEASPSETAASSESADTADPAAESTETEEQSYQAPDFTVYDADGKEVTLSSLFGKPAVLNFWASTCPPCRSEMPEFQEVYEELGDEVAFIMIDSIGVYVGGAMETREKGESYVEEQGFTFPVYYDDDMDAVNTFGITSFPTTYFLDEEGNLVTYAMGAIDRETLELGISMIREGLETSASGEN